MRPGDRPRLAAVIPSHDAAPTLARAVRSVQAQTLPVTEIIIVDDHSTDGTAGLVRQLAAADDRVRLLSATRRGAGHARNLGVAAARAELIAFLDADDVWYPDKLAAQLPLLIPGVAFVGASVHYLGEDGGVLGSYLPFDDWDEATDSLRRAETMPVSLAFSLLRREDLLAAGGFDETFLRTQDLELAQRLVADGSRRVVWPKGQALGGYVLHGRGVSAQSYEEQFLAAELVRARVAGRTTAGYAEWQQDPDLTPAARRALRSGRHYRLAAVELGGGRATAALRHGVQAVWHDPRGVAAKVARRSRGSGALVPAVPPPAVAAEFRPDAPRSVRDLPTVEVVGLDLAEDPVELANAVVQDYLDDPRTLTVFAAHVTSLNNVGDPEFVAAFNSSDARHVDGVSWSLIARAGGDQAKKVATSDLTPLLLQDLARGLGRDVRLAVIGGDIPAPGAAAVAQAAGRRLEEETPAELVCSFHGFEEDWGAVLREVRATFPDVVLIGMGMPVEAYFVRDHLEELPPAVVITCGGWLRILAGQEERAPEVLRRTGLEWAHRLGTDPRRTMDRYLLGAVNLVRHSVRAAAGRRSNGDDG